MNLPEIQQSDAVGRPVFGALEVFRGNAIKQVCDDPSLTPCQRGCAIREINFLVRYERLRRLHAAVCQHRLERRERLYQTILRHEEVVNQLRLARLQTCRELTLLNRDILNCKLDLLERIRRLRPKDSALTKARRELATLRMQQRMSRLREQELLRSLETQTLKRAAFLRRVRRDFPDLAEELIDHYDQMAYRHGERR